MDIHIEQFLADDGVEIKVTTYVEKPKIIISNWPKFTVEWMGSRMEGRVLSPGVYQLGNVVVLRNAEGEYVELVPKAYAAQMGGTHE